MLDSSALRRRTGLLAGTGSYIIWGLLPIYWKALDGVPPMEVLAWRVIGAGVLAWIAVFLMRKPISPGILKGKILGRIFLAALLIGGNWALFIWSVTTGRIWEASLGYYINPLLNVVWGVLFLGEPLGRLRGTALSLAAAAVILLTVTSGRLPWLSLLLALTFSFYALTTKTMPAKIDSMQALALQSLILIPLGAAYLLILGFRGEFHFLTLGVKKTLLLGGAGLATLTPLWLFGVGARRIPLGLLGFLQYIAPTMMLLLGVLIYNEQMNLIRILSFLLVVTALILYSFSEFRTRPQKKEKVGRPASGTH